jgi:hypothetical protein
VFRAPGLLASSALAQRKGPGSRPKTTTASPADDDELFSDDCPEPNGFFADSSQCDKYYACTNGVIEERLCPDGMVFNDYSPDQEKCDLPFNIDCSQRPALRKEIIQSKFTPSLSTRTQIMGSDM